MNFEENSIQIDIDQKHNSLIFVNNSYGITVFNFLTHEICWIIFVIFFGKESVIESTQFSMTFLEFQCYRERRAKILKSLFKFRHLISNR